MIDTGEVIARGCLARDTGDKLIAVMLWEVRGLKSLVCPPSSLASPHFSPAAPQEMPDHSDTWKEGLLLFFLPPLVAGILYGQVELKCPGLGVLESGFAAISFLPPLTAAPGLGYLMLHALNVSKCPRFQVALGVFTMILCVVFR